MVSKRQRSARNDYSRRQCRAWRPALAAGAFLLTNTMLVNAQWFGPGNNPPAQSPPRLTPANMARPQGAVTPAALAPRQQPAGQPLAPNAAAVTQHAANAGQQFSYSPASAKPVATVPASPVEQLLAIAAEQERLGNSWQAINSYRQALEADPQNHRALLSYARMKHRARDFEGAVALYHEMLQYYPQDPIALNDLGLCYARMGDTPQAVATLQQAILREPTSKRYRNNLAVVLVEAGQCDQALEVLIPAHGTAAANYNIAFLLVRLGQNDQAIQFLNATLLVDSSFTAAIDLLAQIEPATPQVASLPQTSSPTIPVAGNAMSIYQNAAPFEGDSKIRLQSALMDESNTSTAIPAFYESPAGELPPDIQDYRIPGIDD